MIVLQGLGHHHHVPFVGMESNAVRYSRYSKEGGGKGDKEDDQEVPAFGDKPRSLRLSGIFVHFEKVTPPLAWCTGGVLSQ